MNKKYFASLVILGLVFSNINQAKAAEQIELKVPYTSEIPNGSWTKPWNNACEEASIVMTNGYYYGYESKISKKVAMDNMSPLFKIQNKLFGSNSDSDAKRTAQLINNYTDFSATIKIDPTLEEIKQELRADRPVISLHYAKDLKNPNHHWRANGSYYHVMVIVGFDDANDEFIIHDSGDDKNGAFHRYTYDQIMASLHDFNHTTRRAEGPATVLFTASKLLLKEKSSPAVYLVIHNKKYPIADSATFKNHGWKWQDLHIVNQKTLDKYETADLISA